jgi:hypothetical protein
MDQLSKDLSSDAFKKKENFVIITIGDDQKLEFVDPKDKRAVIIFSVNLGSRVENSILQSGLSKKSIPMYLVNIFSDQQTITSLFKEVSLVKIFSAFPLNDLNAITEFLSTTINESDRIKLEGQARIRFSDCIGKHLSAIQTEIQENK